MLEHLDSVHIKPCRQMLLSETECNAYYNVQIVQMIACFVPDFLLMNN